MSVIFIDSFDHYTDILTKWNANGDCSIRTNGTARTGAGCVQINSLEQGPTKTFVAVTDVLVGTAFYTDQAGTALRIMNFAVAAGDEARCVMLQVNADGSVSILNRNGVLGTTAAGLVTFGQYNQLALRATIHPTLGTAQAWINGGLYLSFSGVYTANPNDETSQFADGIQLMGPAGLPTCFHDDVYVLDCTTAPNNDFPGGFPRIRMAIPYDDSLPLEWTPTGGGAHYTQVDEIPPDEATNVVSQTTACTDQYLYEATAVPTGSEIRCVQHCLDARLNAGAAVTLSSMVENNGQTCGTLTPAYTIYTSPWDLHPVTGLAWALSDFPAAIGPGYFPPL